MRSLKKIHKRIYEIIEPADKADIQSKCFDITIIVLIIANIVSVILESFSNLQTTYRIWFDVFEIISVIIFTVEYLLRLITAVHKYPGENVFRAIIKYIFSPMAIIDFLAIIPFYIPLLIKIDLRFLRILRLTRLLRILKVNRYSKSLQLLGKVLKRKKEELVVTLFVTMILMLLAASIMYHVESDVQPDAFPNIIASFWWAIATLTTVGYGDIYPVTILGKTLAGLIALLGIGLVALPTGIISSGFMEEFNEDELRKKRRTSKNIILNKRRLSRLKRKKMKKNTV